MPLSLPTLRPLKLAGLPWRHLARESIRCRGSRQTYAVACILVLASRQESIMTRSLLPFVICTVIAAQAALADDLLPSPPGSPPPSASPPSSTQSPSPAPSPPAQMPSQQAVADARAACATDIQNFC